MYLITILVIVLLILFSFPLREAFVDCPQVKMPNCPKQQFMKECPKCPKLTCSECQPLQYTPCETCDEVVCESCVCPMECPSLTYTTKHKPLTFHTFKDRTAFPDSGRPNLEGVPMNTIRGLKNCFEVCAGDPNCNFFTHNKNAGIDQDSCNFWKNNTNDPNDPSTKYTDTGSAVFPGLHTVPANGIDTYFKSYKCPSGWVQDPTEPLCKKGNDICLLDKLSKNPENYELCENA